MFCPHTNDQDQDVEQTQLHTFNGKNDLKHSLKEIMDEIEILNKKFTSSLDRITARVLKDLRKERTVNLMYTFNAIIRLEYWLKSLKNTQIIIIHKPGKIPMDFSSYRPISLLSTISKVLVKLKLKKKSIKTLTRKTESQTINLDSNRPTPQCKNANA